MSRIATFLAAVMVAAATAFLAGDTAEAADATVSAQNFAFSPASVTVNVGDQVTWSNGDNVPHTATSTTGAFDTGNIAGGASASVAFNTAGSFSYFCQIHPNMTGTVVVQAAGGGGGGATATQTAAGGTPSAPTTGSGLANESSSNNAAVIAGMSAVVLLAAAGAFALSRRSA